VHRLQCGPGKVLMLRGIYYGRRDANVCSDEGKSSFKNVRKHCTTKALARLMRMKCFWRRGCEVAMSKVAALSKKSCKATPTHYYMETRFSCVYMRRPRPTRRYRRGTSSVMMRCSRRSGSRLYVAPFVYGRVRNHYRRIYTRQMKTSHRQSWRKLYKICNKKRMCRVHLAIAKASRYICLPSIRHTVVACEGNVVRMSCRAWNMKVKVLYAFYGRSKDHRCTGTVGRSAVKHVCRSPRRKVFQAVASRCAGKHACQFWATKDVFGDKCPKGTPQFLYVRYKCV